VTNTAHKALTDEQLLAALDAALAAAQAELDGLEARRHELEAKVQTLTATRAVYSGQPLPKRRAKRRAKRAAVEHGSERATS
jgi:cell division protein FtsB